MIEAAYTWRPLGALLLEKNLLGEADLSQALGEQRRSGRLLGEILVASGRLSAFTLAQALAEQHGVELQRGAAPEATARSEAPPRESRTATWRPLGKVLVEKGFLTRADLVAALAEQRTSGGRRLLGEILVASGALSGLDLARALGEQQGVALERSGHTELQTAFTTSAPGQPLYEVREVAYENRYEPREVIYRSASFLEAVDFAAELVEDHNPHGVEIQRADEAGRETVWTYSESRAAAAVASRKSLSETFGFDPTLWYGPGTHAAEVPARPPSR